MENTEFENFKDSYDWRHAFYEAVHGEYGPDGGGLGPIEKVVEVIASVDGENDGDDWLAIVKWDDGKYAKMFAGCDYTGWDCQAGGNIEFYDTLEQVCSKNTLTEKERVRLESQLRGKVKLDW